MQAIVSMTAAGRSETAPRPGSTAVAIAGVVAASWLPVLVGATTRAAAGWALAAVLAVALERITTRVPPSVLVSGMVVSSALVASGLVTDATHYMPVAVTAGALAVRVALDFWRTRAVSIRTPRIVLVSVVAYLGWAALATISSADHTVSIQYLVGMVGVCALAFWAIPAMLSKRSGREDLMLAVGAVGAVVAVSVYVVAMVGNIVVFGRDIGDVQLADLTLAAHPTGLLFLRSSGLYLAPLEASITMALGIGALLGWSMPRSGRSVIFARVAIVFMTLAILITLDRTAWLAVIVGSGTLAFLARSARVHAATAGVVCAVFTAVFLLVFVGAVGANAVASTCTTSCHPASGGDETTLRGGTGLSGREYLWKASLYAIKERPILGFGPGNVVPAMRPFLQGPGGEHIETLTSHSTWLRTGVEMGIPGLAFLVAVFAGIGWTFFKWFRSAKGTADPVQLAIVAAVLGLMVAGTFESFLLGGVTFSSLFLGVGLGLVALPPTPAAASTP